MQNKGLTLIEAVIALFLITMGMVGFFSLFQKIINYNTVISSRLIAAYLAQEGIEIVRNIRDNYWLDTDPSMTWDDFRGDGSLYCSSGCEFDYESLDFNSFGQGDDYLKIDDNGDNKGFYNYTDGPTTKFKRKIIITSSENEEVNVVAEVRWTEKGQDYEIKVQENLYKWWMVE